MQRKHEQKKYASTLVLHTFFHLRLNGVVTFRSEVGHRSKEQQKMQIFLFLFKLLN